MIVTQNHVHTGPRRVSGLFRDKWGCCRWLRCKPVNPRILKSSLLNVWLRTLLRINYRLRLFNALSCVLSHTFY